MFATAVEVQTPGCFTWVLLLFFGWMLLRKLSKARDGGGRAQTVAKYAAKRAARNVLFDVVFKRKW